MLGMVRLCLACRVFGGSPQNCRFPRFLHKVELDGSLAWTQNQHQAGTMWWSSQEELGVEVAPSPRGLRRFTTKTSGSLLLHKAKIKGSAGRDGI
jgi:hypothetical protein